MEVHATISAAVVIDLLIGTPVASGFNPSASLLTAIDHRRSGADAGLIARMRYGHADQAGSRHFDRPLAAQGGVAAVAVELQDQGRLAGLALLRRGDGEAIQAAVGWKVASGRSDLNRGLCGE